jgi:signal transduction histidine kinase
VPIRTVSLVSRDAQLVNCCRQALSGRDLELVVRQDMGDPCADLRIWDCGSIDGMPDLPAHELGKCVFLVERHELVRFPEKVLLFAAAVALLPVDTGRLTIALEQAMERQSSISRPGLNGHAANERDALLQCFLQANLRLQEYDQDRTHFLNRALHDLRAPLTSITGYCGLLLSGHMGVLDAQQTDLVQRIESSSKRLSRLANGMFQLGIRPFKQSEPALVQGNVFATVEGALAEIDTFLQQKQITISVELEEPESELLFEPEQITQVLINILENAHRFTPKRSTIAIRGYSYFWERRSGMVRQHNGEPERRSGQEPHMNCYRIDISDSGPGVQAEHLTSVFEEYTSYSGGKDRSGAGLGLAISKGIIELHKGRIWAEPRPVGVTFCFVLPYNTVQTGRRLMAMAAGNGFLQLDS